MSPHQGSNIKKAVIFGRPNSGKTSIFNAISGQMKKVGNWSGVTVAANEALINCSSEELMLYDLPGCHSLISFTQTPKDEKVAIDFLHNSDNNTLLINVVNAANIRRDLYLTKQLLEFWQGPTLVVLNCMDLAIKKGIKIDVDKLSKLLGVSVIPMIAANEQGIEPLKKSLKGFVEGDTYDFVCDVRKGKELDRVIAKWMPAFNDVFHEKNIEGVVLHALEGDEVILDRVFSNNEVSTAEFIKDSKSINSSVGMDVDVYIAKERYSYLDDLISKVCQGRTKKSPLSQKPGLSFYLDNIFLNRILGLPIFLAFMYLMFVFSINFGGSFQDFFDLSSQALFIHLPSVLMESIGAPEWMTLLIANGFGHGLSVTLSFLPVLFAMFFALSVLEQSGYMARAAFIVDRLMKYLGLPGQSFIPMIVGFGCNVPAVMGTRTLNNHNERILTIMMMPFMSCSARLAIYTVFVSAFFDNKGHNIIFALYLLGILVALLTGMFLRFTVLKRSSSRLVLELPDYQIPNLKSITRGTWLRLKKFVTKAGMFIIPACALLSLMGINKEDNSSYNLMERSGRLVAPVLEPMGISKDNWQATVALISGMAAKEVMVGTLSSLYGEKDASGSDKYTMDSVKSTLQSALSSIPENLSGIPDSMANPFAASAPEMEVSEGVIGTIHTKFSGPVSAFSYLLFVLLYFPCISVVAAIAKELNKRWAMFSIVWSTMLAYGVSVSFYQIATWKYHPHSSKVWVISILSSIIILGVILKSSTKAFKQNKGANNKSFPTPIVVS